ncbi:MAG: CvpA family protein [Flavobacteriaceae bacterium]|jgi:membrane protein required for colicin V production|nr:CvpA family protein [Flavobacteriaceae bacterium]
MTLQFIVIGGVVFGAVIGYFKGFLKQVSSLLGLLVGYMIAVAFLSQSHGILVENGIVSEKSSHWISFIITILFVFLAVRFLSGLIEKGLKYIGLGFTNQIAGLFFGAVKYFLIIMIVFSFFEILGFISEKNCSDNLLSCISLFKTLLLTYI